MHNIHDLYIISPEIALTLLSCFSAVLALFTKHKHFMLQSTIVGVIAVGLLMFKCSFCLKGEAFEGSFINNDFTMLFKQTLIVISSMIILSYSGYARSSKLESQTEFVAIFLLSLVGSFIAISARDLLVLFLGLELQSLPAYILAAFATNKTKSSEAGLKYFVLGAISSAILLFGISLIYGSTGHLDYVHISSFLMKHSNISTIVGLSLLLISIMFKLSVVPFHMWTPDVYEGAPIMSVTIFSSIHKISAIAVFVNLIALAIDRFAYDFVPILKFFAIASLIVGAIGAIFQTSVKRLMAFSAILNIGYILLAIISAISLGIWRHSLFTYIVIYSVTIIALFSIIGATFGEKADDVSLKDLSGLGKTKKSAALGISLVMFSMIGIPPLAGFFGKYYILFDLVSIGEINIVIIALAASLIAAYYYLRVIKSIYFDEPEKQSIKTLLSIEQVVVIAITVGFLLCFIFGLAEYFSKIKLIP